MSPTITTLAEQPVSIWQIPFPAVTICPQNKATPEHIDYFHVANVLFWNFADKNISDYELKVYDALSQISKYTAINNFDSGLDPADIYSTLKNVAVPLAKIDHICKYPEQFYTYMSCNDIFTSVMTEVGLCFTFNIIDSSQLLQDNL